VTERQRQLEAPHRRGGKSSPRIVERAAVAGFPFFCPDYNELPMVNSS
jgi:hypothetical protein